MQILSLVWGILALSGMFVAFFPCLGSLNWINTPFSFTGLIISLVALVTTNETQKEMSIAGIVCCGVATLFGLI
jgi:hypothetical protein